MTAVENSVNFSNENANHLEDTKHLPMFPKATSLLFNSGNVVSADRLRRRTNLSPEDELLEIFNNTLSCWLSFVKRSEIQENKVVECRHPESYEKIDPSEKNDISISVKLFLNNFDTEVFNQAIKKIMDEIGVDHIDTLILSLPDKVFNYEELPKDLVLPLWKSVRDLVHNKLVTTVGVADFNTNYLQQLANILEDKNQIPSINQVNLTSCCKMPEDLVEFAKINNVQLTTHIDPKEILTAENLQATIKKHTHEYDAHGWTHQWLSRYTLILKGRGIVKSKGFILSAQRELRYTK